MIVLEGAWGIHLKCYQFRRTFSISRNLLISVSKIVLFSRGACCLRLRRVWTLASTQLSWFLSHRSWCVNRFSKQSAIALAFSDGWNLRPEGPWIAVGALGPSLLRRDFAMDQIAWDVTSVVLIFVSYRSSVFLRDIRRINFVTQLTAVLHAGPLFSCYNFLSLRLYFSSRSRPGI
jgi:hypothetical protein